MGSLAPTPLPGLHWNTKSPFCMAGISTSPRAYCQLDSTRCPTRLPSALRRDAKARTTRSLRTVWNLHMHEPQSPENDRGKKKHVQVVKDKSKHRSFLRRERDALEPRPLLDIVSCRYEDTKGYSRSVRRRARYSTFQASYQCCTESIGQGGKCFEVAAYFCPLRLFRRGVHRSSGIDPERSEHNLFLLLFVEAGTLRLQSR